MQPLIQSGGVCPTGMLLRMQVVLITGGGSGIGKTTALLMAAEGAAAVIVAGRRREPIDAVAAEITALGARALAVQCDVGDQASVQAMFATVKDNFGRLDVLFNNAGFGVGGYLLEDLPLDEWKSVVDTNLT